MDDPAVIASIVAVVFSGVSLIYAHGQKRAADRSATASEESSKSSKRSAVAAETVSTIEHQREHRENRPKVRLWFEEWASEPNSAFLNAENLSGEPVDAVVELVGGPRLAGFEDEPDQRETTHTFENLRPGIPEVAAFASVDTSVWTDATVKFLVTLRRGPDVWSGELMLAKLPPRAPWATFN